MIISLPCVSPSTLPTTRGPQLFSRGNQCFESVYTAGPTYALHDSRKMKYKNIAHIIV